MSHSIFTLAIETSCDDTSAAVLCNTKVLSNITANQIIHKKYGGVVPELASRAHLQHMMPVVQEAIQQANIKLSDIDLIAYTQGPGLLGSLLVGGSFAKALALALKKPIAAINHMQAHILAHFIAHEQAPPAFPFICLTVSGGHTQLVLVKSVVEFEVIGETRDDAAGEAFDKVGKTLGLPYPAGPHIDKLAKQGNPKAIAFPITRLHGFDFSFSGIKTAVLYHLNEKMNSDANYLERELPNLCASAQYAIVKMLMIKLELAIKQYKVKHVALAGGVSANSGLRQDFVQLCQRLHCVPHIPDFQFCTDNAAMIGVAAYLQQQAGQVVDGFTLPSRARMLVSEKAGA